MSPTRRKNYGPSKLHPQDAKDLLQAAKWDYPEATGIEYLREEDVGIVARLTNQENETLAEAWFDSKGAPHFRRPTQE